MATEITSVHTRNVYQLHHIATDVAQLFHALTDDALLSNITETKWQLDAAVPGVCSQGDTAAGYFIHIVPLQRIVLSFTHHIFTPEHYSIVDVALQPNDNGTFVYMNHYGIPATAYFDMEQYWLHTLWTPLQNYFDNLLITQSLNDIE